MIRLSLPCGNESLDAYGGCEAIAMGLPNDIQYDEVSCMGELDNVSTPRTSSTPPTPSTPYNICKHSPWHEA